MKIVLILVIVFFLYKYFAMKKYGNLPFWKLTDQHPEEAFHFILTNLHWDIRRKPRHKKVIGPFMIWNPNTRRRIRTYCDDEFLETTQQEFSEKMTAKGK